MEQCYAANGLGLWREDEKGLCVATNVPIGRP